MATVECITLDDSDEDTKPSLSQLHQYQYQHHQAPPPPQYQHPQAQLHPQYPPQQVLSGSGVRTVFPGVQSLTPRKEQMQRCNFCVDPGLLPVETDRAGHR